jgi:hypothetical protein
MMKKLKIFLQFFPLEGYLWVAALLILAIINVESIHFTVCPFKNAGIDFCPGCGLGRSIHYFIYFRFIESFYAHPLGGLALLILLYRIFSLAKNNIRSLKQHYLIKELKC